MRDRKRVTGLLGLGLALLAAAGCGGSTSEGESGGGTPIRTITVNETEFRLQPATVNVTEPGVYAFKAVNKGSVDHALEVEGQGVEARTDAIAPGDSATLKVDLEDTGSYEIYCPIDGHKNRGMKGSFVVGSASSGSTSTTTGATVTGPYGY